MEALILVRLRKHQIIVPNYILQCTKLNWFITIQKKHLYFICYCIFIKYRIHYLLNSTFEEVPDN